MGTRFKTNKARKSRGRISKYLKYISLSWKWNLDRLFKMSYYTIIIVKCKSYIVYITLAYILYFAPKKGYKVVEYNIIAEYK